VSGRLCLVGTPIGNLGDLSDRARAILADVDLIAAEDTRRTGRLLAHLGIERPMVSLFEGNERARTEELVSVLREGRDVALVTDAGMPSISDPGERLVRACVEAEIEVRIVPGPSAVTSALVLSGLATDRFVFEGFLPRKTGDRRRRLLELAEDPRTIVVFESPRRVGSLLRDVVDVLGDRRIAVARELTKLHEEVLRGSASEVLERLGDVPPKGEIVVVIEGRREREVPALEDLVAEAAALVATGSRKRTAAAEVAGRHGASASANEIYRGLLARDG
jgi:16S rRNA (cytidine1402-2'-O)-methyltransferase